MSEATNDNGHNFGKFVPVPSTSARQELLQVVNRSLERLEHAQERVRNLKAALLFHSGQFECKTIPAFMWVDPGLFFLVRNRHQVGDEFIRSLFPQPCGEGSIRGNRSSVDSSYTYGPENGQTEGGPQDWQADAGGLQRADKRPTGGCTTERSAYSQHVQVLSAAHLGRPAPSVRPGDLVPSERVPGSNVVEGGVRRDEQTARTSGNPSPLLHNRTSTPSATVTSTTAAAAAAATSSAVVPSTSSTFTYGRERATRSAPRGSPRDLLGRGKRQMRGRAGHRSHVRQENRYTLATAVTDAVTRDQVTVVSAGRSATQTQLATDPRSQPDRGVAVTGRVDPRNDRSYAAAAAAALAPEPAAAYSPATAVPTSVGDATTTTSNDLNDYEQPPTHYRIPVHAGSISSPPRVISHDELFLPVASLDSEGNVLESLIPADPTLLTETTLALGPGQESFELTRSDQIDKSVAELDTAKAFAAARIDDEEVGLGDETFPLISVTAGESDIDLIAKLVTADEEEEEPERDSRWQNASKNKRQKNGRKGRK